MSNTTIGGHITVTIGSTPITLTTADISKSPKEFSLPPGQTIDINLGDLNNYLHDNFQIPAVSFPGITETNLVISKFRISSAGIFDIAVNFVFGQQDKGWNVFGGFYINEVGFEVNYNTANPPVITAPTPATGAVNAAITITGTALDNPTGVMFGTTPALLASITNPSATSFTIPVPAGATGSAAITVTTGGGTSNAWPFTVS